MHLDIFTIYQMMDYNQQWEGSVMRESQIRKTRKGWIGRKLKEVHLRDDIPCGFQLCPQHKQNAAFGHELQSQQTVYFVDSSVLINQTDILYNCSDLKNMIVLQSAIEKLRNYNPNVSAEKPIRRNNNNIAKYNAFKSFVESAQTSEDRHLYVLPDLYHRGIREGLSAKGSSIEQECELLDRCFEWYKRHTSDIGFKGITFKLLTSNEEILALKRNNKSEVVSIVDFLRKNNSNLLDFVCFSGQNSFFNQQIHPNHKDYEESVQGIREGRLFEGKYMADRSYCKIGGKMVKIDLRNNRALFGDAVAIQLDPREQWKERVCKPKTLEEEAAEAAEDTLGQTHQLSHNHEDKSLIEYLEVNSNVQPSGAIVSVIRRQRKTFCGSINFDAPVFKSKEGMQNENEPEYQIYEFLPADEKFSKFYIRTYNVEQLKNKRIMVSYDDWPVSSAYPLAHYVRTIGDVGDPRAQGDTILLEHNVQIKQFSKAAYACLPPSGEKFVIPGKELQYRLDLRGIDVVSIDPPGCKDIDDALHCIELPNGNLQVGVHIADVSYYVRPDSALDMQARNRCTTVYLVDRRTDMLPKLLTQNLCSLRSNVDRLVFSTIWEMDKQANVIRTKYCKSIIQSRRAFTYMQAQNLIDSDDQGNIAKSIRNLNMLAKQLKKKRNEQGALTLASTQVKITLAEETNSATDVRMYQMVETNYLIEEFMLLSNISVAVKIYQRFPALSILRRHTQPKTADLQILRQILEGMGYQLSWETSLDLANSLDKIKRQQDDFFNKLVRIMTTRCMNEATYFCSADHDSRQFYHYGLAAPFYTHFTSPIRRYADVLVHRLLAAAIDLEPLPNFMINKLKMTKICDQMNMRNRMARYASRASSDYHTYQFFKDRSTTPQQAIFTQIEGEVATILLVKYGLECKINLSEQQAAQTRKLNQGRGIFTKVSIGGKQYKLFDYVDVLVKVEMKGFHKLMKLQIL